MDGATAAAIVSVVRSATAVVVAGDVAARAAAAEAARAGADVVVEVDAGPGPGAPWSGLAAVLEACRRHAPRLGPPAALEAAVTGRPVGDHLGLAADLCSHLAHIGEEQAWTLLVHDAHRMDLSSAATLGAALAPGPGGVRAIVTQDHSDRGIHDLPVHAAAAGPVAGQAGEPAGGEPRRGDAVRLGAVLDAAAAAEAAGDLVVAAAWWLDAGRPRSCERALQRAEPGAAVAAVRARLLLRSGTARHRREVTDQAVALLDQVDLVGAASLRVLDASTRIAQGDVDGVTAVLHEAAATLDVAGPGPVVRAAQELHDVVRTTLGLHHGDGPAAVMRSIERPLARLGAGGVDADAVQVLGAAAVPLGRHDYLDEARTLLDRLIDVLDSRRRFVLLAHPLASSAWLARRRGRLELALTHGSRAIDLARACGWRSDERRAVVEVAHVEALQGRLESCRRHVATLVPPGELPRGQAQLGAVSALAVGELLTGAPERAVHLLEPVQAHFAGAVPPSHTAWRHNLVEAYVRTGRRADAEAVFVDLASWAERTGTERERGTVAWCRGMLAPARQHDEHFTEARLRLVAYPTLRWRAALHHLRRLLAEGRMDDATSLADRLVAEATAAGLPVGPEMVRRLQRDHGVEVPAVPSLTTLSVEDLRIALALAEGADVDEVAVQLRLTPRRVEAVRSSVLDLLEIDDPGHLAGFLQLERSAPHPAAALVRILGPTVVERGEQPLLPPPGRPAAVLALLGAHGPSPIDRVLDVLWPDVDPERSRPRLRNVLARLRAAVGPVVARDGERLVLAPGVEVDARRFERLADEALRASGQARLERSAVALAAWSGEPLPAWPYEDWALRERDRLVQVCVSLHAARADLLAGAGSVGSAIDELEQAIALQPEAHDLWQRAVNLAEADERIGRARSLRRRAADHDIELV